MARIINTFTQVKTPYFLGSKDESLFYRVKSIHSGDKMFFDSEEQYHQYVQKKYTEQYKRFNVHTIKIKEKTKNWNDDSDDFSDLPIPNY